MEKYKFEELKLRRKRNLVKIMHTQSKKTDYVEIKSNDRNLRSTEKINLKNTFTSKTKVLNSPLYRGTRLWNSLPVDIQKEENKYSFKRRISLHKF